MTIYKIEDFLKEKEQSEKIRIEGGKEGSSAYIRDQIKGFNKREVKGRLFSSLAARLFFVVLLIADIAWGLFSISLFILKFSINCITLFVSRPLRDSMRSSWLSVTRSAVCMMALIIAIFSPPLGIMFACLYFLMYDKSGVEEIVPSSLRDQFHDFFPK